MMVNVACPFPTEPKMKLESRTGIVWFACGKTRCGASGPVTKGITGNGGAARGVIPRSNVAAVGDEAGAAVPRVGKLDDGGGAGTDWQPARINSVARRWRGVRMQKGM